MRQELIERLIDRIGEALPRPHETAAVPVGHSGPTLFEGLADQMEGATAEAAEQSERIAQESQQVMALFREVHMGDPYAGCRVVPGPDDG